jgi:hypothetical protein
VQRLGSFALATLEIAIISALVLATRCANYQDVFVGGNVYFTDADCYARMTRVRMCAEHPGLIVRHHDFENFPQGTSPHTTAPLDYLILGLSILLNSFSAHATDFAGALVSPLLALLGGWFLWWWSRHMKFRWVLLILYAISPILAHGSELGRPDHHSLSILLVTVALCAEWRLRSEPSIGWSITNGMAWALAIWVSAYEPLLLLMLMLLLGVIQDRHRLFGKPRRVGWIAFAAILALALLIEQRIPSLPILHPNEIFRNWSRTIGELLPVAPLHQVWFRWAGYMFLITPILIWIGYRKKILPPLFIIVLLIATYGLTIWQARWGYFFISIFALTLPCLLETVQSRAAVWIAFSLSILPILRDWDEKLWPYEAELSLRLERRREGMELRELATGIRSPEVGAFMAPWWLSPQIAYWSSQPGVAGSSHESLDGIAETARFFLADDWEKARAILDRRKVTWVFGYDGERVTQNSAAILGSEPPAHPLCQILSRTPAQAPSELVFSGQNPTAKLFRFGNNR